MIIQTCLYRLTHIFAKLQLSDDTKDMSVMVCRKTRAQVNQEKSKKLNIKI